MKAWYNIQIILFISGAFAVIPVIMSWLGIYWIDVYQITPIDITSIVQNTADSASGYTNAISMLTIPIQFIQVGISLIWMLLTANKPIMVDILHIPVPIWGLYAIYHYLSLLSYVIYLFTGRMVEDYG